MVEPLHQYDKTVMNDADGWVNFVNDPKADMYLRPGFYRLTEEDDPNDTYKPCTIPPNGLLVELKENGRFCFRGEYMPKVDISSIKAVAYNGPEFGGRDMPKLVINCEFPAPAISVDKKVNGSDGPISLYVNDDVHYTFKITNTGNTTLSGIEVEDSMVGVITTAGIELAPGATFDYDYHKSFGTVGTYTNIVTASGMGLDYAVVVPDDVPNAVAQYPELCPKKLVEVSVGPVTDAAIVNVSNRPTPPPSSPPSSSTPSNPEVTYVNLVVTIEGPGAVLPGSGAFSRNSQVQFSVTPGTGATFVGWFGTNGAEVSGDRLLMNADKAVIARFAVPVAIPAPVVPQAAPVVTPDRKSVV